MFLLDGFVLCSGVLDVIDSRRKTPSSPPFAELALFSVLFTDGMRVTGRDLCEGVPQQRDLVVGRPVDPRSHRCARNLTTAMPPTCYGID